MARVLIVDNDRDMCKVISTVLESEGYKVDTSRNGKSALAKIKKRKYDALILDYKLHGISGLTVLERVREIRPSLKTIMISAYGDSAVRARAKELGVYSFIDKPFDIKRLEKVVDNALKEGE